MFFKAQISILLWVLSVTETSQLNSENMADIVHDILDSKSSYDWLNRCPQLAEKLFSSPTESLPKKIVHTAIESNKEDMKLTSWRGVPIIVPMKDFTEYIYVNKSIMSLQSTDSTIIVTKLDLAPHFDMYADVPGFSPYVLYRNDLIAWINDALKIRQNSIICETDTIVSDMIKTITYLYGGVAALSSDQSLLMYLKSGRPAILLGNVNGVDGVKNRIKYVFQNPDPDVVELITVAYILEDDIDLTARMNQIATALLETEESHDVAYSEMMHAMLNDDYDQAASLAGSLNLQIKTIR